MSLYFLFIFDGEIESGVIKKIFSQIKSLNDVGMNSEIIFIGDTNKIKIPLKNVIKEPITNKKGFFNTILKTRKIANIIGNRIRILEPCDIIYIRYPLLFPFCPFVFFKPFRKCKVIFEYNSFNSKEYLIDHNYFYLFFEYFFGNFVRYQADAGIAVTNEISNYQRKKIGCRNKSFITIANGIDVESVQLRTPPNFNKNNLF